MKQDAKDISNLVRKKPFSYCHGKFDLVFFHTFTSVSSDNIKLNVIINILKCPETTKSQYIKENYPSYLTVHCAVNLLIIPFQLYR